MSSTIWKNFYLCFSNLKFALPTCTTTTTTTTTTPSSNHGNSQNQSNNSFQYDYSTTSKSLSSSTNDVVDFDFFSSPDHHRDDGSSSPPDLTTVRASQRFFFSSPGRSNSIFEPPEPALEPAEEASGGIAVRTYSPDPFSDFRRSMQEMVEARDLTDADANWDFLHELLLCYLTLNPKHTHKYIVSAFSDLLISLMPSTSRRKIDQSRPLSPLLQRRP